MSKADIVLIVLAALGAWSGYREGFLLSALSLLGLVLGVLLGFKLMGDGMIFLENKFDMDRTVLPYVAFFVIFLLVVLGVRLLGKVVKHSIDQTFLGSADQAMGAVLGTVKTLFMISVFIWILDSLKMIPSNEWSEDSWLYPFTARMAPAAADWAAQFLPLFRETFREFGSGGSGSMIFVAKQKMLT